jgi:peptidoglycan hydrolase CwlO-like protein
MTTSNPGQNETRTDQQKTRIIWILALALIGTWIYLLIDQQSKKDTIQRQQADITTLDASKVRLQQAFDESLIRLDSLGSFNDSLKQELGGLQQEIVSKKAEIRKILKDRNVKQADLEPYSESGHRSGSSDGRKQETINR